MLTIYTQKAINILCDIKYENNVATAENYALSNQQFRNILDKMVQAGLICLADPEYPNVLSSYTYCYPEPQVTLYRLLVTLSEGVYPIESMQEKEKEIAKKHFNRCNTMYVLDQMIHTLLNKVTVTELYTPVAPEEEEKEGKRNDLISNRVINHPGKR